MRWGDMVSFGKARPDQADAVFSLYREVVVEGRKTGTSHWSEDYPTRAFLDEDIELQRIFVLQDGSTLIAAVSLLETDDLDDEPVGWQDVKSCVPVRLCVSPRYQGQHIGEYTMNCLVDYAKSQGYQSMRLLAAVNGVAANRLYTRMGFVCLGVVELYEITFNAYELILSDGGRRNSG